MNLFAYVMRSMLPPAIQDCVVETELNINNSHEFQNEKIQLELTEIEEHNVYQKKPGSDASTVVSSFTAH